MVSGEGLARRVAPISLGPLSFVLKAFVFCLLSYLQSSLGFEIIRAVENSRFKSYMLEKLTIKGFKSIQSSDGRGLFAIRERCPHFDRWLQLLESFGDVIR